MPADKRTEVKIYLTSDERARLDQEASRLLITRGQLIRDRALGNATTPPVLNVRTYTKAVTNAARICAGLPRPQLEAVVASVVTTLAQTDTPE